MTPRTNLVRRVKHIRPVILLEDTAANDRGFVRDLEDIGRWASAQLEQVLGATPTPCFLPPAPRHVLDKKLARASIARMRAARLGRGYLPFWTTTNYVEALLRSAISGHLNLKGNQ